MAGGVAMAGGGKEWTAEGGDDGLKSSVSFAAY